MSEERYTPGPWEVEYGTDGYYKVTHSDGLDLRDHVAAHEAMIGASPALLEALTAWMDHRSAVFKAQMEGKPLPNGIDQIVEQAKAAITAATRKE